jgi:ABC-type multidrug transport system fused ATPase/permease subunit
VDVVELKISNIIKLIYKSFRIAQIPNKRLILAALAAACFAVLELFTISTLLPVIAFLMGAEIGPFDALVNKIPTESVLGKKVFIITLYFMVIFVSTSSRYKILSLLNGLSNEYGRQLARVLMEAQVLQEYKDYNSQDQSDFITNATHRINTIVAAFIHPSLISAANSLLLAIALLVLLVIFPLVTISLILGGGVVYLLALRTLIYKVKIAGEKANQGISRVLTQTTDIHRIWMQMRLSAKEKYFADLWAVEDSNYRTNINKIMNLSILPRYIIEASIIILLVISVVVQDSMTQFTADTAILFGVYVVILLRTLPILQQTMTNYQSIQSSIPALINVMEKIEETNLTRLNLTTNDANSEEKKMDISTINVDEISYLIEGKEIIAGFSFRFEKGKIYGIVGASGVGKSTLLKIIGGLIEPTRGKVYVNDDPFTSSKSLKTSTTLIAQSPSLFTGTISENIQFGEPEDFDLLNKSISAAKLDLVNQGETSIGSITLNPSNASLSGGQLQRLEIARAFYNNSDVMLLDEFTSALDQQTEKKIINEIQKVRKKCITIIVTHRDGPLEICDQVIRM